MGNADDDFIGWPAAGSHPENLKLDKIWLPGWWLGHPAEKYEFVNWDDDIPNISQYGNQTTNQFSIIYRNLSILGQFLWLRLGDCAVVTSSLVGVLEVYV